MKKLVKQMVTSLVDHPREVKVTEIKGDKSIVYELRCHATDVGKVIGRSGKTVGAMRTLLGAIAARDGHRVMLEVVE
jgi:predicted RNA-binding protein YlqC (UPF0109 family)